MKMQRILPLVFLTGFILLISSSCTLRSRDNEGAAEVPSVSPTAVLSVGEKHTYTVSGLEAEYILRLPVDLDRSEPVPVVFVIHGIGSRASYMVPLGFNTLVGQEGFVVVYPDYINLNIKHIQPILSDLETRITIDPRRIFATGFSLGGAQSYKIACEMSDIFAAVAPISGTSECVQTQPNRPISVLHIHGLDDSEVPYEGNDNWKSTEEVVMYWAEVNGCDSAFQEYQEDKIMHRIYTSCQYGTAVELYTIEGMIHELPNKEMPAAKVIWDFFKAHPKQ